MSDEAKAIDDAYASQVIRLYDVLVCNLGQQDVILSPDESTCVKQFIKGIKLARRAHDLAKQALADA